MADQAVTVQFGAKTDELDRGADAVHSKLQELQNQTNAMAGAFDQFGTAVKAATDSATTSLDSVTKVVEGLNDTIAKAGNVSPTSGLFGTITNVASRLGPLGLAFAAIAAATGGAAEAVHHLGEEMVTLEDNAARVGLSTDRFQQLQQAFALGGVKAKEFEDGVKKVADALRDLPFDKTGTFAKQLDEWGIKWKEVNGNVISMNDYLEKSAGLLQKAANDGGVPLALKVGEALKLSDDLVKVLMKGPPVFDDLKARAAAAGAIIDEATIKKAAQFTKEWDQATVEITLQMKAWLAGLLPAIQEWGKKVKDIVKDAFTGWWSEVKTTYQDKMGEMTSGDKFKESFGADFGGQFDNVSNALLSKFRPAMQGATDDSKKLNTEIKDLNSTLGQNADKWNFVGKDAKAKFDPTALREFREQLDEIKEKYTQLKLQEQEDVTSFKKTEAQKVADLKAALDERERATEEIFAQEIDKYGADAKMRATIERNFNKEYQAIQLERLRISEEALKKNVSEWEQSINGIAGAFNSQLSGLLGHTITWGQAMANVGKQVVIKLIEEFEKLLIIQPLLKMLSGVASPQSALGGLIGGGGQTAALTANTSALTALTAALSGSTIATTGQTVATTGQTVATTAETAATTAETAAQTAGGAGGIFSFLGSLAKFLPGFEVGTNYVPSTGLAMVHQGEAIIPASQNIGGAGYSGFGTQPVFQVQALDSAGVQAFFNRYGPQIAKILSSHMNQNPSYGL